MGMRTFLQFASMKPLPQFLLEDFNYYRRAAVNANSSIDPYQDRSIGTGFLYPPPALLIIDTLRIVPNSPEFLEEALIIGLNMVLLGLIVYGVASLYHMSLASTWWWYVLCFCFSPFLELQLIGQINVITSMGIFLLFFYEMRQPILAGVGLALGVITKVTPLGFFGYLVIRKDWKTGLSALAAIIVLCLLTVLRYGVNPFLNYLDVFQNISSAFPNSGHSLISKIRFLFPVMPFGLEKLQTGILVYFAILLILSALLYLRNSSREPLFLLTALAISFSPNIMWYHHYVFILLPMLILLGWSRNHFWITAWVFTVLMIIQVDRFFPAQGLMTHIAVQLTIFGLLAWQILNSIKPKYAVNPLPTLR